MGSGKEKKKKKWWEVKEKLERSQHWAIEKKGRLVRGGGVSFR